MRYLTRAYVDWLGLGRASIIVAGGAVGWVSEMATKPLSFMPVVRECVKLDGRLYIAEGDGLAFARHDVFDLDR